jgi:hypothetical protein
MANLYDLRIFQELFDRRFLQPMFPVLIATAEQDKADDDNDDNDTTKLAARQGKLGALRGPCRAAFLCALC